MTSFDHKFLRLGDDADQCWPWIAAVTKSGYGAVWADGGVRRAHVVAFEREYGPIPPGAECCHSCQLRSCVRPSHLRADSHKNNLREAADLGRMLRKLTLEDVRRIRALAPSVQQKKLAKMFRVDPGTIRHHLRKVA